MTSAINEAAAENKHTSPQICTQCTQYTVCTQYTQTISPQHQLYNKEEHCSEI